MKFSKLTAVSAGLLSATLSLLVTGCGGGGSEVTSANPAPPSPTPGGSNVVVSANCVSEVKQGFTGKIEEVGFGTGDGGSSGDADGGGAAAGGGFGKVLGGMLRVTDLSDGTVIGEAVTDSVQGLVTIKTCKRVGPFLLTLEGRSGAKYFDEGKNTLLDFGVGNTFHALIDQWDEHAGVSPMTEAAYRYALNNIMSNPADVASGKVPLRTTGSLIGLTIAQAKAANEKIAKTINTQNIDVFGMASIKTLSTPIDQNSSSTAVGNNKYGISAIVNGGLATSSAFYNPANNLPALKFANDFAQDLTDGRIDGFSLDKKPISDSSTRTYHSTNLPIWNSSGNGGVANRFANGKFQKTNVVNVVYRLEYDVNVPIFGSDVDKSSRIVDTAVLKDDGVIDLIRNQDGIITNIANFSSNVKQVFYGRSSAMDDPKKSTFERVFQKAYILKNDGTVYTWGSNATCLSIQIQGPISEEDKSNPMIRATMAAALYPKITSSVSDVNFTPRQLTELSNVTEISVGPYTDTALARTSDGSVYQWGRDVAGVHSRTNQPSGEGIGQLINQYKKINEFQAVSILSTAVPIPGTTWSAAPSCVIRPTKVNGISGASFIVAGANAHLVSTNDGLVYSWGKGSELGLTKEEPITYLNNELETIRQVVLNPTQVKLPFVVGSLFRSPSVQNTSPAIVAVGLGKATTANNSQAWEIYQWGGFSSTPFNFHDNSSVRSLPNDIVPRALGIDLSSGIAVGVYLHEDGRVFASSTVNSIYEYINVPKVRFFQQIGEVLWMYGTDEKIYRLTRLSGSYGVSDITNAAINGALLN